jgi:dethiobiotin synthetase
MHRYVVTGTDTDVGKTVVAAALAAFLGASYWKPVQAGTEGGTDSQKVAQLAGTRARVLPEAYVFRTPCSPHEAARIDGVMVEPGRLELPSVEGPLVVEGAGGVLVPFATDLLAADLFAAWGLPVILVARTALGTINHSLLSIEAVRRRGLTLHGVIFVGEEDAAAEAAIVRLGQTLHLGRLPRLEPLNAETLDAAFADCIRTDLL